MESALDLDGVQAFVLTADLGSFTRAAEVLATSQAAISLRLKRLEERLGARLLDRTPRHVRLTARGEGFLAPARALLAAHEHALAEAEREAPQRLVLGISDHVAGAELPRILSRIGQESVLTIEVRIGMSADLLAEFRCGRFDAVIVRSQDEARDGVVLSRERLGWFAAQDFAYRTGEPVRLANLACTCGVRAMATQALDQAGLNWSEVFVGGGVLAVGAAVSAGLGIAALAPRVAPLGAVEVGPAFGLPTLPNFPITLHARPLTGRAETALRIVTAGYRGTVTRPALVA